MLSRDLQVAQADNLQNKIDDLLHELV